MNSFPTKLSFGNSELDAIIQCKDNEIRMTIGDYLLETIGFYQNWEVSEDSFKKYGNKFGFQLIGEDHEIFDLTLAFSVPTQLFNQKSRESVILNIVLVYKEYKIDAQINIDKTKFSGQGIDLENAFIDLSKKLSETNQVIRSCFSCALSGYEKGGSALFCMKKERSRLLSKTYNQGYKDWFEGIDKRDVSEFHQCNEYEFTSNRMKY